MNLSNATTEDLKAFAAFFRIVKNYMKMKELLITLIICLASIKINAQSKMPNPLERKLLTITFSTDTTRYEMIMQDSMTGKIHWVMKSGKDSIIYKWQAKILLRKWSIASIPKRTI